LNAIKALELGWRRVGQARRYVLIAYLLNLSLAFALGIVVSNDIRNSLGNSLSAERLAEGYDDLWFAGFHREATGLSKTFHPAVSGFGAVAESLDAFVSGNFARFGAVTGFAAIFGLLWVFLSAGFIGMFYSGPFDSVFGQHFFAEAGRHFLRFLMLALMSAAIYALILAGLLPMLGKYIAKIHRETIMEPAVFRATVVKYAVVWLLMWLVNIVFDFSKVIVVVNDVRKKDVWRVPLEALRFILKRPLQIMLIFGTIALAWVALIAGYWLIAPGAWQSNWFTLIFAFLLGQLFIFSKVALRCWIYGSETAYFYFEYVLPASEAYQLPEKTETTNE
jgi:hypothetical protein